jgi:pilus assembly protein FimV
MVVHLASPEEFERVGLERPHEMSANLTFTVTRNAQGEPVVRVTTPQRMTDPYVSFLLEAEWGNGKMVREYTALLEPPHTVEVPHGAISAPTVTSTPMPAPAVSPPVVHAVEPEPLPASPKPAASSPAPEAAAAVQAPPAPEPVTTAPEPAESAPVAAAPPPEPTPPPVAPEPAPAQQTAPEPPPPVAETPPPAEEPASPAASESGSITVSRGQTLSSIAGQMRSPDVSLNRMMIALQRTNPDAFIGNNINRLKAGAVLRMPDADQARAVTPDEANALVHEQVESWRQGAQPAPQLQPEEASGSAAKQASNEGTASKSAASSAAGSETSTASVAGAAHAGRPHGAHLEILPPVGNAAGHSQSGSSVGGSGSELRAELAQTQEELVARKAEITDLKAHVADLEKIKTDSQKLLGMKDSQLAALQQRLAELEKKDADAAPAQASPASPAANASTAASAPNEATAAASPATSEASPAASGAASAAASPAAASTAAEPAASPPKKPAPVAHAAPRKPQEQPESESPWFMQPFVLVGGGLVLFAGLLGLMLRRPRKSEPPVRRRSFDVSALPVGQPDARARLEDDPAPAGDGDEPDASHAVAQHEVALQPVAPEPETPAKTAPPALKPIQPPPATGWTAATRIEAARAYIENGDVDNARSMLEAALIEGNATQQEEAFKLLDMIESW